MRYKAEDGWSGHENGSEAVGSLVSATRPWYLPYILHWQSLQLWLSVYKMMVTKCLDVAESVPEPDGMCIGTYSSVNWN